MRTIYEITVSNEPRRFDPQRAFGKDVKILEMTTMHDKILFILEGEDPPGIPLEKKDLAERLRRGGLPS